MTKTLARPQSRKLTDATGTVSLEWDTHFNSVQVAVNNVQANANFTLAAAASTTVNDKRVTASSAIGLTETNASAATLQGSAKRLYVSSISAGVSFTVSTANGAAAAGTETFNYTILG